MPGVEVDLEPADAVVVRRMQVVSDRILNGQSDQEREHDGQDDDAVDHFVHAEDLQPLAAHHEDEPDEQIFLNLGSRYQNNNLNPRTLDQLLQGSIW